MAILGAPTDWADLIDPMLPVILNLVITSWANLPQPTPSETEDKITNRLCRSLQQNRTARKLMFQIRTQVVELEPAAGEELGRMDIVFIPLVPREDIYFCLESKRLNVVKNQVNRAYAAEYVEFGMQRFVTGQYSKCVRHGGMLAYVLNGDLGRALTNVEQNIGRLHKALGMRPPGVMLPSKVITGSQNVRLTEHRRVHDTSTFSIHHIFVARSSRPAPGV